MQKSLDDLLDAVDSIRPWSRGFQRAPHKPLLLLFALSRHQNKAKEWARFREVEGALRELLVEFGPTRRSYHPEYPFWRLAKNDGLWELRNDEGLRSRESNSDPPVSELRRRDVAGRFPEWVQRVLDQAQGNVGKVAKRILDQHFAESLHEDIAAAVGIDLVDNSPSREGRDPRFREAVLMTYGYRCAVCGYDVRVGHGPPVGLEAAHIRMHRFKGPSTEDNGLALCSIHHKLFDYGAFTLSEDGRLLASMRATGSRSLESLILDFHGQEMGSPRDPSHRPAPEHIGWHTREVFKGPARPT